MPMGLPSVSLRLSLLSLAAAALVVYTVTMLHVRPQLSHTALRHSPPVHLLQDVETPTVTPTEPTRLPLTDPLSPSPEEKRRVQREKLEKQCFDERDYGMVDVVQASETQHCTNSSGVDPALVDRLSTYTHYDSRRADIKSTLVTNLWVDLRNAEVFKQIQNLTMDGHTHDPRFRHASVDAFCVCNAPQDQTLEGGGVRVWDYIHGDHPTGNRRPWRFCQPIRDQRHLDELGSGVALEPSSKPQLEVLANDSFSAEETPSDAARRLYKVQYVKRNAIIMGRRDDHNPFFQISLTLNTWFMMKVVGWSPETTQLVYFDDGLPSPTDDLQRRVLAPVHPAITGRELIGSMVHFDKALVAPFEYSGPLMRHLNNNEPCRRNALIKDLRDHVMSQFGVLTTKRDPASCTITIISRRPYGGRMVQRKWLNEDAILERMQEDYEHDREFYKYGTCRFQSLDFVDMTIEQQMRVVVESDVIIGMHGAGMVNLLWSRPETVIAEIFPLRRKRWGYRNICHFVGCKWFQFRGGTDTGKGDNTSDKLVSYADWFAFFDPIIRDAVSALESRVAGNFR